MANPKILHLIGQLSRGGAEKQLFCLAATLAERRWRQVVVSLRCGGIWKERLEEIGIPVREIPPHWCKPWRLWQLQRIVWQEKPAILQSWSPHTATYSRWLLTSGNLRRIFGLRLDLTRDATTGQPLRSVRSLQRTLKRSDCVISNSRHALMALEERGIRLPPNEVIYNIVHPLGRASPGTIVSEPIIAAAGRLISRKAYDVLFHAAQRLAAAGKSFQIMLAGDGPEKGTLARLAVELEIANRVCFLGEVDDVPTMMASCHLLVHPARSEGLSNTIIEAMAEGLPVVCTSTGTDTEIMQNGKTCLLVPNDAVDALAAAIGRLLDDHLLRKRLGEAGLEVVRQQFSAKHIAAQYELVYRRLLKDEAAPQPQTMAKEPAPIPTVVTLPEDQRR
jgi:glycosyltransferase involved in cell wall biosynthesis